MLHGEGRKVEEAIMVWELIKFISTSSSFSNNKPYTQRRHGIKETILNILN